MSQPTALPAFSPLACFPNEDRLLSADAQKRWLLILLIVGVLLRLTRYLLRFPLWEDEAMLSANFIDRDYAGLLQPLHYCQVAPIFFLWGQLAITKLLGFNEYALRLIPFVCGLASLFLFRHVAGRLLQGVSLVLAVGLFAVAYPMTRYAAEAKPYGCDLLIALAILALVIEWLRRPDQTHWLWYLAALVGPAVGYSFPTIFIGGGVSLVIGWMLLKNEIIPLFRKKDGSSARGLVSGLLPWFVLNAILVGGLAATMALSKYSVDSATQQNMDHDWAETFPPITEPLKLPLWLLDIHTGAMLGYPVGGPNWGSSFSFFCLAIGVVVFGMRRQWLTMSLLLLPLGLNFVAAALHRFPYGGHARMTLFLAPAFCTLIGFGLAAALAWIEGRRGGSAAGASAPRVGVPTKNAAPGVPAAVRWRLPSSFSVALVLLMVLAGGSWLRDLAQPYKSGTTLRAREFAQWFWFELPHDSELVSCETDLATDLSPTKINTGWSSLYLCNQRIYSPRHSRGEKPAYDRVSAQRPLRCVLYRSPKEEQDSPSPDPYLRERWLANMQARYDLVGHDSYPFAAYDKSDRKQISDDYLEVFTFVPKPNPFAARPGNAVR